MPSSSDASIHFARPCADNAANIIPLGAGISSVQKKGTDTFVVNTTDKAYQFRVPSVESYASEAAVERERDEWVNVIMDAMRETRATGASIVPGSGGGGGGVSTTPTLSLEIIGVLLEIVRGVVQETTVLGTHLTDNKEGAHSVKNINDLLKKLINELGALPVIGKPGGTKVR